MERKPAHIHGGCKTPVRETPNTCIVASDGLDQVVAEYLQRQGVVLEFVA